jgi:hypothetical protein
MAAALSAELAQVWPTLRLVACVDAAAELMVAWR